MAIETLTPAMLVFVRYTISGTVMLAAAYFAKAHLPRGKELWYTALFGALTIGVGNGCLAYAELWVPSGLAALFITTSPFWLIGVEALIPGGDRLHGPTIAGMLVGLGGTVLLVAPAGSQPGFSGMLKGFLLLQLGCFGWALGSIAQRRHTTKAHPVISSGVQQLATGVVYFLPAMFTRTGPVHWSGRSIGAVLYLMTFGSIIGYSAYVYAMEKLPVSVVSIYSYVNPVVALFLGWLFYREHVGMREILAMLIIFSGVALVNRYGRRASNVKPAEPVAAAVERSDQASHSL